MLRILLLATTVLACEAATSRPATSPSRASASAPSTDAPPAASGAPPAPAPEPGERPTVACPAKHAIVALTLGTVKPDEWSDAILGYRPQAHGGRPTAWDGDTSLVDAYLEGVHACVHAAFADSFLRSLRGLAKTHALSDPELSATVEIVIEGETGRLAEVGVVGSSGVPEFDAAAVAAFARAFPLEGAPPASLSSDGRLYVTWEMRRSPEDACKRSQARPWKLRF